MQFRFLFKNSHQNPRPLHFTFNHHHQFNFCTVQPESTHSTRTHKLDSFNKLLNLCLQKFNQAKTHNLLDEMSERLLATAKVVHGQVMGLGFWSHGCFGYEILDLYAKCGNVVYAKKVFDRLGSRDVLDWNSVLSMHLNREDVRFVVECFGLLWNDGVVANEHTFALVLSACARLNSVGCGRQVHCSVVKTGLNLHSYCEGALIDMYAKCGCVMDAKRVFDEGVDVDMVAWTSMIQGFVRAGLFQEAVNVFEEVKKAGKEPDQVAYVTVMNAFVNIGRLDDANGLFLQMPNKNVVAWNVMISGHTKRGNEAEAINYFIEMRKFGIKPTRSTLGSVLSAVGGLAAFKFGSVVHSESIKLGFHSNVYVGSSLISMYAKCEKMEEAEKVFDSLDEHNVVSWNSLLGGYAQNGYARDVVRFLFNMKKCGFQPDDFTYTSILSACAVLENLDLGRQLHCTIIKNKFSSNLFVGNAIVDMYAKSGSLDDARQQFEVMKNRDKVSWNAIIVGYVQDEDEYVAFDMFCRMILLGILPDEASLASVTSACANIKNLELGKQIHALSVKCGLDMSLYVGSSHIDMYAKCGEIGTADRILELMPQHNIASINALIAGYAPINLEEAVTLLREMQNEGLNPSGVTFMCLLDSCNEPVALNLGRGIHGHVIKNNIEVDNDFLGVSLLSMYLNTGTKLDALTLFEEFSSPGSTCLYTAMISGLTQNDSSEEALQYYKEMRSYNVLPDQAAFVSILRACSVMSSIRHGREVHSLISRTGFNFDETTCSSLSDMYAKCGDVNSSLIVFKEMRTRSDVITWNSIIVGLAKNGFAKDALKVFEEMKKTDVAPDDVTFLGVLTACSHAGMVHEGRQIFSDMVNIYGLLPRVDHCACFVDLLGRWGFLEEAENFIETLDFQPDARIWATMLGACRIHGDEIRGQRAANKLIELEPQNSSSYVLLSNIYAASGNWDEVNSLRRAMREKGVKKSPGCSWITVGEEMNMFIAGDKSHSSATEIDAVLKDLTAAMREDRSITLIEMFSINK